MGLETAVIFMDWLQPSLLKKRLCKRVELWLANLSCAYSVPYPSIWGRVVWMLQNGSLILKIRSHTAICSGWFRYDCYPEDTCWNHCGYDADGAIGGYQHENNCSSHYSKGKKDMIGVWWSLGTALVQKVNSIICRFYFLVGSIDSCSNP